MIGIFLYVCLLAVFGFLLAIVTGVIAKEEITVKSGMVMTFVAGILSLVVGVALAVAELGGSMGPALGQTAAFFALMALMLWKVGGVPIGKAAIVAVIYSVVYFGALAAIHASLQVPDHRASARS